MRRQVRQYPRVRVGALELVLHRLDPLTNPRAEAAGGKELNVDQRAKVSAIDDMQQVRCRTRRGRVRRGFGGAHTVCGV